MKKIFILTFMLMMIAANCFAEVDKNYYNGDKNYIFCGSSMGAGFFVDRNSLKVEKYEPPIYVISIGYFSVGNYFNNFGEKIKGKNRIERFKYDYSTKTMYLYTPDGRGKYLKDRYENNYRNVNNEISKENLRKINEIDWNSEWTYIDPDVFYREGAVFPTVGEIAFALAYNLKFHGSKFKRFSGDFYDKIGDIKDNL